MWPLCVYERKDTWFLSFKRDVYSFSSPCVCLCMPQLDLLSYAAQFLWLTAVVGTYYVFSVSTLLPTTGTLLKARAAQEVDPASLSTATHAEDLTSMALVGKSLAAHTAHVDASMHVLASAVDNLQLDLVNIDAVWKKAFQKDLFAQAAVLPLQASVALCGAYGSAAGMSTLGNAAYLLVAKNALSKSAAAVSKKASAKSVSSKAASKPKKAGKKASSKKTTSKKK